MNIENIQRIALIAGLVLTGYLLIQAWNQDYGGAQAEQQLETANAMPELEPVAPTPDDAPAADVVASAPPSPSEDVPSAAAAVTAAAQPVEAQAPPPSGAPERLVEVASDTLRLWIDRQGGDIVKASLLGYPVKIDQPDVPLTLLNQTRDFTYIAQSGLTGTDGPDGSGQRPLYNVLDEAPYEAGARLVLEFRAPNGLNVRKVFELPDGDHLVTIRHEVRNGADEVRVVAPFAQIKSDGNRPDGPSGFSLGPQPYWGGAVTTAETPYEKLYFSELDDDAFQARVRGGWIALLQHYFLSAWIGSADAELAYYARRGRDDVYRFGFAGSAVRIEPGTQTSFEAGLYIGPKDQIRLAEIATHLNLTVDYGFLWWIAAPLFYILRGFHETVGNWGLAIILLTLVVKLLLYPLSAAGYRSMANMRRVAPEMKRLQERHKDDRQKLSQEMMALYQKEKINPLGGCLPILVQMPVFLALYWVLYESVELRHAPFFLWIDDLSAMDPLFVLPLLMGGSMYLMQLLSPPPPDPTQAQVMRIMPVMFTFLFLFFPAGLVLYWLCNNVLSVAQQWYVTRQVENAMAQKGA